MAASVARPLARVAVACALAVVAGCGGSSTGPVTASGSPSPSVVPVSPTLTPRPPATSAAAATPSATPRRTAARPSPSSSDRPTAGGQPGASPALVLWRGSTSRKVVALTFDAGSDAGHTTQILDLLRARGVLATFGLTGAWVRANPALARRIAAAGHQVVNHTDRHLSFTGRSTGTGPLTRSQRIEALAAAERSIVAVTGASSRGWMRPPFGDRDAGVDRDVGVAGYRYELMWTVDTLGWKGVPAGTVTRRVLDALVPGEIVLMHVGAASSDASALPGLLDALQGRGYRFVRADQL
jgi:peptidoglycan/xylan/chitin deacetylase (PgdA/CDA1 family)